MKPLLDHVKKLASVNLPPKWGIMRLEVKFVRQGLLGEYASVIYDPSNSCFYVKTNKSIVYPGDEKALLEAIEIMHNSNTILQSAK